MRALVLAALLVPLALPFVGAAEPTTTSFDAALRLAGDATHKGNAALVPDASFQYELRVDGVIDQVGKRLDGQLTGVINITYRDEDDNTVTVDSEPVTLQVVGTRAPFVAQGLDGFRLNVHQTGQSGNLKNFVIPGAYTTGVTENDDGSKAYAVATNGKGQAQFKDTQHWQLDVVGTLTLTPQ